MNNTKKTLKNGAAATIGQTISIILSIINRRLFILFLDIEFLGYQSLFGNIFSILAVADLGISNLFCYHLYRELENENEQEIGKLMYLYKTAYRTVAICVLVIGCILSFFLPYIVNNPSLSWDYIRKLYFLQLGNTVLGYFMVYRRTLYICDQKSFICVKIDAYVSVIIQVAQILALAVTRNYIIYLVVHLSTSVISNMIIARKTNRDYPYLKKKYAVSKEYFKEKNIFTDLRNAIIHKLTFSIYSGTDNIIISAFCGIRMVALYGNYYVISTSLTSLITKMVYEPFQATIGKIVYSGRKKEELWTQFEMLDFFSYIIASMCGLGMIIFYQFAIQIWMGKAYLLPSSFVIAYSMTIFLSLDSEMIYRYRAAFGEFSRDRNFMILSTILNIVLSIALTKKIGITGVQIGTLVAFLPISYGRIKFVVEHYFEKQIHAFMLKRGLRILIFCLEGYIVYFITSELAISVLGFIERGIICLIIIGGINSIIFFKNPNYRLMLGYAKGVIVIIRERIGVRNIKRN